MQDGIYVVNSGGAEWPPSAMGTSVVERFRVAVGVPAITVVRGGATQVLERFFALLLRSTGIPENTFT